MGSWPGRHAQFLATLQTTMSLIAMAVPSINTPDVVMGLPCRGHQIVCKGRQGGLCPVPPV